MKSSPQSSFDFLLGRLPVNKDQLFSDASGSFGMAGVLMFGEINRRKHAVDGLFWQLSWEEWRKRSAKIDPCSGHSGINTAEFLAALITCESFASYCSGYITSFSLDNSAAKSWLDRARCTRFPYDRCAQGTHLYMLEMNMKVRAYWISSGENEVADVLSRRRFPMTSSGCSVKSFILRKVRPKWRHVLRFV